MSCTLKYCLCKNDGYQKCNICHTHEKINMVIFNLTKTCQYNQMVFCNNGTQVKPKAFCCRFCKK